MTSFGYTPIRQPSLDFSTLRAGDRVVQVNRFNGEWDNRTGWNEFPARVVSVSSEQKCFRVERYNSGNTYGGELLGRLVDTVWPMGTPKAKPFSHTALWALASDFGYEATHRVHSYPIDDKLGRGWV